MNNDTLITDLTRLRDIAPTAEIRQRLSPLVERAQSGFYRQPGRIPVLVEALNALDDLAVPAPDFGLHLSRVQALAGNGFYHLGAGQ